MKVFNIKWVTDGADVHLPIEVDVPRTLTEFEIADFLSDLSVLNDFSYFIFRSHTDYCVLTSLKKVSIDRVGEYLPLIFCIKITAFKLSTSN